MKIILNRKTKMMFYSSIILTLILITITVLFIVDTEKRGGATLGMYWIGFTVVLLAVFAVVYSFIMRIRKEKKYSILGISYKNALDDIILNISTSNMSFYSKRQIEEELLDLFILAVKDGKKVEDVIGMNKEEFIKDIIKAHGARNNFFTEMLSGLQYFIIYLFLIQIVRYFEDFNINSDFFKIEFDNSTIILFALIAFITIPLIRRYYRIGMNKDKIWVVILAYILIPAATFAMFIGFMEILKSVAEKPGWIKYIVEGSSRVFDNVFYIILYSGVFFAAWIIKRQIQRSYIKNFLYD